MTALALLGCAGAAQAQNQALNIETADPASFAKALTGMGYKPGPVDPNNGAPLIRVPIGDFETVFAFGGCTDGKACTYLLLVSRFTDLKNPPAAWVNARNAEYDLGKAWIDTDDGTLAFSMAAPTGGEPLTTPMMRFMLDQWRAFVGGIAQSALKEKLAE